MRRTGSRNLSLVRVSFKNLGFGSRIAFPFYRIEAAFNGRLGTRADKVVGVEFPTVVNSTAERHVVARHFVHARCIVEQHVENLSTREALLGVGRIGEVRFLIVAQGIDDNTLMDTDAVLHILLGLLFANINSGGSINHTSLAIIVCVIVNALLPLIARERRVQASVGIVNNSGQGVATRALHHRVRTIEATIRFGQPLILIRDKEDRICRISFIIGLQRNRLGDIFFCRTVHAKSGIKHLGIVTHEHDVVRDRFAEPYIVEPSTTFRVSRHTHGRLATVQAHHRDSRHPGVIFFRNEEVYILGVRRSRSHFRSAFSFWILVNIDFVFITGAGNERFREITAGFGFTKSLGINDSRYRIIDLSAVDENETVILRIRLRLNYSGEIQCNISSAILGCRRRNCVGFIREENVAGRPGIRQLDMHRTQASCKRSLHPCKKQHYT